MQKQKPRYQTSSNCLKPPKTITITKKIHILNKTQITKTQNEVNSSSQRDLFTGKVFAAEGDRESEIGEGDRDR